ncbi:MAG: glycosyltransferase [Planctomycetia bacterium]|nr:glycosyltransferase [Planctomycetia bacterium]
MKVLLNTTTLNKGGALQTSGAFILQVLRNDDGIDWTFAVSRQVADELAHFGVDARERMIVFEELPSHSKAARRQLSALEAEIRPDVVFTFSGPAYVRFRNFHLMGCSNPWVTHSTLTAYRSLFPRGWADNVARNVYRGWWFRAADAWVVQTETAQRGLARRLRLPAERIDVISNTCGERYLAEQGARPFPQPGQKVRILSFSAPYRQKNLQLLPRIAQELARRRPDLDFSIVITLPEDHYVWRLVSRRIAQAGVARVIENRGRVPVAQGPDLYRACDICLLPTLLETFSANYPEAMAMGLPIVTTDLDFAREVCGDAALYYRPHDAGAAAECVLRLLSDRTQWERQIARGKEVLKRFPTPHERYRAYVDLLRHWGDRLPARERHEAKTT